MTEPLWATGPGEILRHGLELLVEDTDRNRRLAMIAIDNSVELMLQTYVSLPKRITGISISRRDRDEICSNFPKLLDGIETHATEKIIGIDLGEIEWFHRLRNELYHQGNGLTVERTKVEVYAELAKVLFENLFDAELSIGETDHLRKMGDFMDSWVQLEKELAKLPGNSRGNLPPREVLLRLVEEGHLTKAQMNDFDEVRRLRNEMVHGKVDAREVLDSSTLNRTKKVMEFVGAAAIAAIRS